MSSNALFTRDSPIMRPASFNRAENCADVAIAMIAAGGCRSISAGSLAGHLRVTPAAVLTWFGTTAQMWEQLTEAIGRRWFVHLGQTSRLRVEGRPILQGAADLDIASCLRLFLPLSGDEVEWTRVWLSLQEHGRHHDLVGSRIAQWERQELERLHRVTACRDVPTLTHTLVLVRGLRQMVTATHEPLALEAAHDLLTRHCQLTYVENGPPEPASDDDVLDSTRRFAFIGGSGVPRRG
ncbi:hypothetical protein [Nocardioides currus]|uniref:TetR family transcriptional regulator n=1 Tax=Nocardioides currus TaxID=2133958 RepID=A0A2R7YYV4_9ACTN|nr:hypothetical protein [Nocardioides currus]PUA81484.1 hypothetical protein C7S10_05210 [Nocardioides currus]